MDDVFGEYVRKLYTSLPKRDSIYVVREVQLGVTPIKGKFEGAVCVLLVGLVNPKAESRAARERGFNSERFRSLDTVKALNAVLSRAIDAEVKEMERHMEKVINEG